MTTEEDNVIDLRSDTVTRPTEAMRRAMFEAQVGDDVYGEDPTVSRLEALVAETLGKEAAVFVASGTMANLVSVLSHCQRGDEMILGDLAHIFLAEQGGAAALGGIQPRTVPNLPDGTIDLKVVEGAVRSANEHYPVSRLICVENTHNFCGGQPLAPEYMDAVGDLAHSRGLSLHVDGARLWNAAVALNVSPARLVRSADSVSVCLSKGLAAPVGSLVAGTGEFIRRARRNRKVLGGGMRQAGVIAAAGIVAVTEMVERLADDHSNARRLAHGLQGLDGLHLQPASVQTNIVFFDLVREDLTPGELAAALRSRGVLLSPSGGRSLRAVTNRHVSQDDVDKAVEAARQALAGDAPQANSVNVAYN